MNTIDDLRLVPSAEIFATRSRLRTQVKAFYFADVMHLAKYQPLRPEVGEDWRLGLPMRDEHTYLTRVEGSDAWERTTDRALFFQRIAGERIDLTAEHLQGHGKTKSKWTAHLAKLAAESFARAEDATWAAWFEQGLVRDRTQLIAVWLGKRHDVVEISEDGSGHAQQSLAVAYVIHTP
jgi:hypothetical protein